MKKAQSRHLLDRGRGRDPPPRLADEAPLLPGPGGGLRLQAGGLSVELLALGQARVSR